MKHKIVFFDMDGTLYQTERDRIQDSSLAALKRLKDAGYLIGAVSTRPLNEMKRILSQATFDYYVLMNGSYILDRNFDIVSSNPLATDDVNALVEFAGNNDMGLMVQFGDSSYIYNEFYPMLDYSRRSDSLDSLFYDQTRSFHRRHPAYNTTLLTKNSSLLEQFIADRPHLQLDLVNVLSNGMAFELFNAGNGKDIGIESVLEREGLGWEDVIAFGDSLNDLSMLRKAGLGIAMGQARDEVKEAANRSTTAISNNGVFNAIKAILAEEGF